MKSAASRCAKAILLALLLSVASAPSASAAQTYPSTPSVLADLPPHIAAVMDALTVQMRGTEDVEIPYPAVFENAQVAKGAPIGLLPDGAILTNAIISKAQPAPGNSGVDLVYLAMFRDALDRRSALSISVRYRVTAGGIVISQVAVLPQFPARPEVSVLLVPAERMDEDFNVAAKSSLGLLAYVSTRALTGGELAAAGGAPRDYYLFGFAREQVASDAAFAFAISQPDKPEAGEKDMLQTQQFDFSDWKVFFAELRMPLSAKSGHVFKIIFRPGSEAPESRRAWRVVGEQPVERAVLEQRRQPSAQIAADPGKTPGKTR